MITEEAHVGRDFIIRQSEEQMLNKPFNAFFIISLVHRCDALNENLITNQKEKYKNWL